ncbi:hypothetical protein [Rubrivirga sp. IMCC45206]|uniref:hypothetical protein n=1 Tax=Rubrivirga sp. IMCC45206 TaxID=3391614 RepID=UPI00398FA012
MNTARLSASVSTSCDLFAHRGFELRLLPAADAFAFEIGHHALTLHRSDASFRTPFAAERAARQHVDAALGAFDAAHRTLAA